LNPRGKYLASEQRARADVTAASLATSGIASLFDRVLKPRVAARWYAFAVGYMLVVKLTVALIHRITR
jgi:hypothetical protein